MTVLFVIIIAIAFAAWLFFRSKSSESNGLETNEEYPALDESKTRDVSGDNRERLIDNDAAAAQSGDALPTSEATAATPHGDQSAAAQKRPPKQDDRAEGTFAGAQSEISLALVSGVI